MRGAVGTPPPPPPEAGKKKKRSSPSAAWVDEDDEGVEVHLARASRLKKLRETTWEKKVSGPELERRLRARLPLESWARKRETTETPTTPPPALVDEREARLVVTRRVDANGRDPSRAVVQAVDFLTGSDASSNLMLAAGLDKHVRVFQVDGERNERRVSLFAKDLPFYSAKFVRGRRVAASGRRPYFYFFDVETAKATRVEGFRKEDKSLERFAASNGDSGLLAFAANDGRVRCCDAKSGLWAHTDLRMNGTVRALAFGDDRTLFAGGGDGDIYSWDLRVTKRCLGKFQDRGQSITSSLALSDSLIAVGSESGVVNLYDRDTGTFQRAVMNLSTPVDRLALSGDFLALSSKWHKDALRIANLRTHAVYANWPTNKTPLHFVSALAFSAHDDLLAIGNDRGRVLLYQLRRPD